MGDHALRDGLADLLEDSLGLSIWPRFRGWPNGSPVASREGPFRSAFIVAGLYLLLFCGLPGLAQAVYRPLAKNAFWALTLLQVYGAFWAGWATASTKITSGTIWTRLDVDVLPLLPPEAAGAILDDLKHRFDRPRLLRRAWVVGLASAMVAGVLISRDLRVLPDTYGPPLPLSIAVAWWSLGWSILFTTSAKVVMTSGFYRILSLHLDRAHEALYGLDPARSPLLLGVATISQAMLLFWLGIAISIALAIPFGVKDWIGELHNLENNLQTITSHRPQLAALASIIRINPAYNSFILAEVFLTGWFSIGVGTVIFVGSEAAMRRAVQAVTHATLRQIEAEVAGLTASSVTSARRSSLGSRISMRCTRTSPRPAPTAASS